VRRHVDLLAGMAGEPVLVRVYRWREATPQLELGHAALMEQISRRLTVHARLAVTASWFRGSDISDFVADAHRQAARLADWSAVALTA
jgi:protoporphyrinogen oxidase